MFHRTVSLVSQEYQPLAAFNAVASLASFHRIQCSPGIRAAANHIRDTLIEAGIDCRILSYPAGGGAAWWSQAGFDDWSCHAAELALVAEDGSRERLCSFAESKISLIQRSVATPVGGLETSIVFVDNATEPSAYAGLDVTGKLVFSRGDVSAIAKVAVDRFGAAGIVVDNMRDCPPVRERLDLVDGRQYLAFWPSDESKHRASGFVLTPRRGDELRRRLAGGKELKVWARVDSAFGPGAMEVVTAVLPGTESEEVVALAHLCHPEPSANDNASGCGALVEAARALARLIESGRLGRPRRTIRFLWLPEMTGSYAYLAHHEPGIERIVAAINLDMVGENQALCGSTFMVEKHARALPGFGGDLAEALLRLLSKQARNYAGTHSYPMFRWSVSPYSGGSDHYVWSDPTVGVTCPQLIQWPDKFYHTSEDTIDKVDPAMLGLAGVLTASYLHTAACGRPADAAYLAGEMASGFGDEVRAVAGTILERAVDELAKAVSAEEKTKALARARRAIERRLPFLAARKSLDVDSLVKMAPDSPAFASARQAAKDDIAAALTNAQARAVANLGVLAEAGGACCLPPASEPEESEAETWARGVIPQRTYRGPFSTICRDLPSGFEEARHAFNQKHPTAAPPAALLQYWSDGKRTLAQVADLVECETGARDIGMLADYAKLMELQGALRLRVATPARA